MTETSRIDVGEITLAWGNPATIKAELREESAKKFQLLPLGERLLIALSMVELKNKDERPQRP